MTSHSAALQVAQDIRDPTSSMIGHASFGSILDRWVNNKQSLPAQQQSQVAAECRNQMNDRSSTGAKAQQHKFRVAAHVILTADPGLADQVARVGSRPSLVVLSINSANPDEAACYCCFVHKDETGKARVSSATIGHL